MAVAPQHTTRGSWATRRSGITAIASAVAAVALAVAVAGRSCGVDESGPIAAVREFATAANAGDRDAIYHLLGPETQRKLEIAARRATDLVGGARRYDALDLISISRSADAPAPKEFNLLERSESRAVVEVVSRSGERDRLNVVKIDGQWRIELPTYNSSP